VRSPNDWIITIPKIRTTWEQYERELEAVADRSQVMNYRIGYRPREMEPGDRCFVVHDGRVRGWMEICGVLRKTEDWRCSTTGVTWPAGWYMQRTGTFHHLPADVQEFYPGFRGIRRYIPKGHE
jgi:hypothetical protein